MTTKTYPIEIEGLPEGWKAVAYRLGKEGEMAFINKVWELGSDSLCPVIIVEKIQPRRKLSAQEIAEGYDPSSPSGYD